MTVIKAVSERALGFLNAQRLPASPQNYWLAFACVGGRHAELARTVETLLDGGVRLKQSDADDLFERFFGRSASAPLTPTGQPVCDTLRHQTLRLADLAASAAAVTGEFSRELACHMPDLANADSAGLERLVATALHRARLSERELIVTTAEVEKLRQKLEAVKGDAERDALTGLFNRRGIDAFLATACDSGRPHVLAICDIDRFKSYNDKYGHGVGDRVLKTVAQTLRKSFEGDFVGRWGGEEFLVVIAGDLAGGLVRLETAKATLGDKHFKLRETDEPMGRITFSAGAVPLPGSTNALSAAIERADALLYEAKAAGRDRVKSGDA